MASSNHQSKHTLPSSALRFYKIITTTTLQRQNLRIPYGFTKIHGDHVPNPLFLKPPDGKEWKIHWNKHEGDILFQKGWKEFSKYYSLAHGHMVWFEYDDKETCHIRVHIFNKNKVEIKYPLHRNSQDDEQHNINQIQREENSVEIPVDEQLPCKKRRPKSPMSRPQPPKKLRSNPSVDDLGRSSKLQNMPKHVQVKEEIDEEQEEQLTSRIPNATNLKSKIPSFEVLMKSTYVEQYLHVPSEFAMKYLSTKTSNILLKVMDERRTWLVSYYFSRFGVGWKAFASDNNLKVGDICQFELTNSQPLTFKVLIYPHRKQPQESAQRNEFYSSDDARIPNVETKTIISSRGKKATKRNSLQTSPCTFTNDEALEEAEKFTSTLENPHFILNLKTSNWRVYRPRVQKSFFYKNSCKPKETVMLKFRGKLWPVTLLSYPRESSNRLGAGWKLFAEERKLVAGDVCVLELINREDAVLDVRIFRGHS